MFNFIKGLGKKIRDFSIHIIEMMDVNAEFEGHKYGYKIPDGRTLINHFLWLYFYYNQYKIVSRFYETRHCRSPGESFICRSLGRQKFLSYLKPRGILFYIALNVPMKMVRGYRQKVEGVR